MFRDFKDLLSSLNDNEVKYLVAGGYAVGLHAQPRVTKDLDIFVKADAANAAALHKALDAFGAPVTGIAAAAGIDDQRLTAIPCAFAAGSCGGLEPYRRCSSQSSEIGPGPAIVSQPNSDIEPYRSWYGTVCKPRDRSRSAK